MGKEPLVSVVMPAYNGEKYIGKAIQSILDQTYQDWELIIVDDCGTDKTMEIVNKYKDKRIQVIHNNKNEGIAFSRNKAIENSRGDYIAILDDDDIALPNRLKIQVDYLDTHPEISVVGGRSYWIDDNDQIIKSTTATLTNPLYIAAIYLFSGVYINCTCMFRKELFTENKIRYQHNMLGMEDVLFWIECSKVAKLSNVEEFVSLHRDHPDRESNRVKTDERANLWAKIHDYSLKRSGLILEHDELEIIHRLDPELVLMIPESNREEIEAYYHILHKIANQAEQIGLENAKEIRIACKKRFSRALEYSYLWRK